MSFGKFGGLPTLVAFPENWLARQKQMNCFKYECQWVHSSASHHWMWNTTRHSVLKVITIRWSRLQSSSNKPLKLVYFGRVGYFNWWPFDKRTNMSPVLIKCWNWELILSTNFGSLCRKVTNFGNQNFGYQIWFCTRLMYRGYIQCSIIMTWSIFSNIQ